MSRQVDSAADLVVEDRFAIVPEWLLDAEIGDAAVRLYAVLLRYGQSSGARMPSWATLARRLRKKSTDSVDRAIKELTGIGAVRVEHRYDGAQRLTNWIMWQLRAPAATNDLPSMKRVAANLRLPRRSRQGVAARMRAGWPQIPGMTQSS